MVLIEGFEVRRNRDAYYKDIPILREPPKQLEPLRFRGTSPSSSQARSRSRSRSRHSSLRDNDDYHRSRQIVPRPSSRRRSRHHITDDDDDSMSLINRFKLLAHLPIATSSDSDSSRSSSSRSHRPSHHSHKPTRIRPCGPTCNSNPNLPRRLRSPSPPPSPRTVRNRTLLYGALATCATIGTANTFYQTTKARRLRKKGIRDTEMCHAEEKRTEQQGLLMDVFGLGCMAIGVNNVRIGWGRYNATRKEGRERV